MIQLNSLLILPSLLSLCLCQNYTHTIYVNPENGSNSSACLTDNSINQSCRNLSYALLYGRNDSTRFVLSSATHYLTSVASDSPLTGLRQLALVGQGAVVEDTRVQCSSPNAGLAFVGVTDLLLENVTFIGCTSLQNSTSRDFTQSQFALSLTRVALYFSQCADVSLRSVNVRDSPGGSAVTMYNTIGSNSFTDCIFSNNSHLVAAGRPGGGGVYVEFSYCLPGDTSCANGSQESYTAHNQGARYTFTNCSFEENNATNIDPVGASAFILPYRQNHDAFGRGGGLSIFLSGNATGNSFLIKNCSFLRNQALWGGGMVVSIHDTATGNKVSILDTVFYKNSAFMGSDTAGGGLRLGQYVFNEGVNITGNNITLVNCSFYNNTALNGGAMSYSPAPQKTSENSLISVSLYFCTFEYNKANLGSAVHMLQFALIKDGVVPPVLFYNVSLSHQEDILTGSQQAYEVGGGGIYLNGVKAWFRDSASFYRNQATALILVQSEADFQNCSVVFRQNIGLKGGAMALLGAASFVINDLSFMLFSQNKAQWKGGAIYNQFIDRNNFAQVPHCFVRHTNPFLSPNDWNATFYFIANYDHDGHVAIHTTSLLPCSWAGGTSIGELSDVFCWPKWYYLDLHSQKTECTHRITSSPGNIDFSPEIQAFAGRSVGLPLNITDDRGKPMQIGFHAFSKNPEIAVVNKAFEFLANNTLKFTGIEGQNFSLELDSTSQRTWHVEMKIMIRKCPPGFAASSESNTSECKCIKRFTTGYNGALLCDDILFTASLSGGHWMGKLDDEDDNDDDVVYVGNCPPQFCFVGDKQKYCDLPDEWEKLENHLCGTQNRKGILCGECIEGYGPAVNPSNGGFLCVECDNINKALQATYYILAVYVPLFLVFLCIIVFNIKLTAGSANAFILYSQVISSTFDLYADGQIQLVYLVKEPNRLIRAYNFLYGVFNLRFFEQLINPLCLSPSFNTLDILSLDYIVGLFPLLMIILVIVYIKIKNNLKGHYFCPRWRPQSRLTRFMSRYGESIVPAFASFLLLSYNKFCLTSSYIVSTRELMNKNGALEHSRVYYAGQYSSTQSTYLITYYTPAVLVLVLFCSLPPFLLLEYPLNWLEKAVNKVSYLKRHYPTAKVQIFLDAFQGCYRNGMRFFAGLYFIFRLAINLSYTLSDSWIQHYIFQGILCVVFIVLLALCQPYNQEYHIFNYIDILMFANLAIINSLSLFLYALPSINPRFNPPLSAFVIQYILVFLPLLIVLIYLIWFILSPYLIPILRRLKSQNNGGSLDGSLNESRSIVGNLTWSVISASETLARKKSSDSGIDWDRAKLRNTYRPNRYHAQSIPTSIIEEEEVSVSRGRTSSGSSDLPGLVVPPGTYSSRSGLLARTSVSPGLGFYGSVGETSLRKINNSSNGDTGTGTGSRGGTGTGTGSLGGTGTTTGSTGGTGEEDVGGGGGGRGGRGGGGGGRLKETL